MGVAVKRVRFLERTEDCIPSYSKQDPGLIGRLIREGWKVYSPGNGWAYLTFPLQIIVTLDDGEANVAPFFREYLGRLTQKRVDAIIASAPREIVVEGDCMNESDLDSWLDRARTCASRRKK